MVKRPVVVKSSLLAVCVLAGASVPALARAALGGPEADVPLDVQILKGSLKSSQRSTYEVHEIQLPSGTVLREFSVPGGNVFAVAWQGPSIPDLRQALGTFFDEYTSAARSHLAGRNHLVIEKSGLVVQSSGHMRAFSGRAYIPAALPAGTSLDEIH